MKALLTILSIVACCFSANVMAGENYNKVGVQGGKIVIDLGHYSHKKTHRYKNKHYRNKHTHPHALSDHHHPHSHGDYAKHHHYIPDYYVDHYQAKPAHCWAVKKKGYWKGRKALVGGQMCRDDNGYTYVVPTSRYLIKYRGRYH